MAFHEKKKKNHRNEGEVTFTKEKIQRINFSGCYPWQKPMFLFLQNSKFTFCT